MDVDPHLLLIVPTDFWTGSHLSVDWFPWASRKDGCGVLLPFINVGNKVIPWQPTILRIDINR